VRTVLHLDTLSVTINLTLLRPRTDQTSEFAEDFLHRHAAKEYPVVKTISVEGRITVEMATLSPQLVNLHTASTVWVGHANDTSNVVQRTVNSVVGIDSGCPVEHRTAAVLGHIGAAPNNTREQFREIVHHEIRSVLL
jgi:hypothetical protein